MGAFIGSLESAINSLAPDWLRARSACTCLKKHAYQSTLAGLCRILDRSDDEGNRPALQAEVIAL
jgi:hypothetical protein